MSEKVSFEFTPADNSDRGPKGLLSVRGVREDLIEAFKDMSDELGYPSYAAFMNDILRQLVDQVYED